jgi:hypothetical protein
MAFHQKDLQYSYSRTAIAGDNPKISGVPDSILFNRHEGYEVLYLINKFMETHNLTDIQSGQKIERMIRNGLPGDVRSQHNVISWIANNWKNY